MKIQSSGKITGDLNEYLHWVLLKSFIYSKSPNPDDNRLQNSGFMSLAISTKDLYLLHKWMPFLMYLSDFGKWDIKLKVFSSTLKWYKKFNFRYISRINLESKILENTEKSQNIHFCIWELVEIFEKRTFLLNALKRGGNVISVKN